MTAVTSMWYFLNVADKHGVPPWLIAAIVNVESSSDAGSIKYEREYPYLYTEFKPVPPCTLETEVMQQRTSWGLMQVMGATARWLGVTDRYLTCLVMSPYRGLDVGCKFLAWCLKREGGNVERAVARYNGGKPIKLDNGLWKNQKYVDKVMSQEVRK